MPISDLLCTFASYLTKNIINIRKYVQNAHMWRTEISDVNKQITLSGWVQRSRKMGGMTFIDLRDRYGITQLVFNEEINAELCDRANKLGRDS